MNRDYIERIRENCSLLLLNVGHEDLHANWNWKNIYSPFARIYIVTRGEAVTTINGIDTVLKPDHIYLTPPFTLHDDYCDSEFSLYYIHLFDQDYQNLSLFKQLYFPIEQKAEALDLLLVKRLIEINPDASLESIDPSVYDNSKNFNQYIQSQKNKTLQNLIETEGILNILISKFLNKAQYKGDTIDKRLSEVLNYIHNNINNNILIKDLSNVACTSDDHLIRIFKKEMGITPINYINKKRIEHAQLLLLTTDKSIKEVAYSLSIDNVSYFNLLFKRFTGKSPSEFRNSFI